MKWTTILVIAFFVFGGFLIVKYNNYQLDNPKDDVSFVKDFGKWMFGVGKSTVNVIGAATKAAANETWLPDKNNKTNSTKNTTVYVINK